MYLTLCLIARDENSYLQEWLDYHILLGVEHFWIYDNESTIPLTETLKDYVERGWVTVHTVKGRAMQLFAYDHCLQTYGSQSRWIGFIDTDEFIVLHSTNNLPDFLTAYEEFGGLAVSSLFFGHSGNKSRPKGGQITGYRMRAPDRFSYSWLVKSIVQPAAVLYPSSPHSFFYRDKFFCVNENGRRVEAQEFPCHVKKIQLNHYFTRSEEEWNQKLLRGRGDSAIPYQDDRGTRVHQFATIKDTAILKFLQKRLPCTPKDKRAWENKTESNSLFIVEALHQAASEVRPVPAMQHSGSEVAVRQELNNYYQDLELSLKLFDNGEYQRARDFWAAMIEKYPFQVNCYLNFCEACLRLGDYQNTWNALAQAWRIAPNSFYVLLSMVDFFYTTGDYGQAEKTSLLAAAQGNLKPEGVALLALSQWKQGKQDQARTTAKPLLDQLKSEIVKQPVFIELLNMMTG